MKYSCPCKLYWIDPIFCIEQVSIDYGFWEEDGVLYYISSEGAYFHEYDLFNNLEEARGEAIKRLQKFYSEKMDEIMYSKPREEDTL